MFKTLRSKFDDDDSLITVVPAESKTNLPGAALVPVAPTFVDEFRIDPEVLLNLLLKVAYTLPKIDTKSAAEKLCIPMPIAGELLEQLRTDKLLDILGQVGPFNFGYAITGRGREHARRLLEISGYIGPAPISVADYNAFLLEQFDHMVQPSSEEVEAAISEMVLPEEVIHVAGLAALSRRSLFLFGAAGNGKTTLGHLLHDAVAGDLWVPYSISVGHSIIRVYDPQCHERVSLEGNGTAFNSHDRRWVRIKRPFVVVGGELTLDALDLIYSESLGFYEAPLHFKANGGTFLLDDFGCQRVEPRQLLNRWIHPLERHVDFLTLRTGQQVEVPFRQMLIVSTNLNPEDTMTPAFLRRMGYRVELNDPSPQQYAEIFRRYAARHEMPVPNGLIEYLLKRYQTEGRPLRACEPRDLIDRARDSCRYLGQPLQLTHDTLNFAWNGYFGMKSIPN